MSSAVVRITRGNENFGMLRKLRVFIDDVHVGDVGWNETVDFSTTLGAHAIYVKMDWYRSAPYLAEVLNGQVIDLEVTIPSGEGNFGVFSQLVAGFFQASRFFGLKER